MKDRLTVVTYGYPNAATPTASPFIKVLVEQWKQKYRIDVKVINPVCFSSYLKCKQDNGKDNVYYPLYFSYRFLKIIPSLRKLQTKLSDKSFLRAVKKTLDDEDTVFYAHFLNAGLAVADLTKYRKGSRAYCAFGESTLWSLAFRDMDVCCNKLQAINKFISVSSQNTNQLIEEKISTADKVITLPNGIDASKFRKEDKAKCREELNLPQDDVIGIFVGHFIERKGPKRVEEATAGIPQLKMIYIGAGEDVPKGENVLFCGRVQHELVGKYLSAADFFVLPTLAEGCCNAIVEAMACGLPVISSVGEFNDDILDAAYAIRVDPMNIAEIRNAVETLLYDEKLRQSMSKAAQAAAKELSIEARAKKILDWMELAY